MKMLLQLFIACLALRAFSMEASNSYVSIRTACADVLSIKPVGKDFHLLVVNASAQATVEVSAIDPWELVEPISGSCGVTLAAEGAYEVKDAEPDEEGNREPNKDGRIVMFKPMFRVSPDFPSGMSTMEFDEDTCEVVEVPLSGSDGELTDNHTATVHYEPIGAVRNLKGHDARMIVYPKETGCALLHHQGVDPYSVSVDVNVEKEKWRTSKIYWYGVSGHASGVGCCYKTRFEYVFDLFVDGVACYSRSYNVGWPKCTPAVLSRIIPQYAPIVLESFVDPSGLEKWKAVVEFRDCGRESVVSGMPYINQYGNEIMKEEDYHCKQFKCEVPLTCGSCADLFTAVGMLYWVNNQQNWGIVPGVEIEPHSQSVSAVGFYKDAVFECAVLIRQIIVDEECAFSWELLARRRNWSEYQAKRFAAYNAAFKYHCTYGNGNNEEPTHEKHPAYK